MASTKVTRGRVNPRVVAKLSAINDIITAHRSVFTAGSSFTAEWLDTNLASLFPRLASSTSLNDLMFARITAYTKLNKVLAERGLYIKSTNYYSEFKVLDKVAATKRITGYAKVGTAAFKASTRLAIGVDHYSCKWRKLTVKQLINVAAYRD